MTSFFLSVNIDNYHIFSHGYKHFNLQMCLGLAYWTKLELFDRHLNQPVLQIHLRTFSTRAPARPRNLSLHFHHKPQFTSSSSGPTLWLRKRMVGDVGSSVKANYNMFSLLWLHSQPDINICTHAASAPVEGERCRAGKRPLVLAVSNSRRDHPARVADYSGVLLRKGLHTLILVQMSKSLSAQRKRGNVCTLFPCFPLDVPFPSLSHTRSLVHSPAQ